ncbi:hypothetical protein [Actinoplanes sp. NPDC049316]|uniref:hypothetical protein n=1 Tax=Actinoplanes sp. NPDC049316 TaxID=3154727 RepID=UPI0034450A94
MTTQHVEQVRADICDPEILRRVRCAVDELDSDDAAQFAIDHGVAPPSNAAGWELLLRIEANRSDESLVWVLVTETD